MKEAADNLIKWDIMERATNQDNKYMVIIRNKDEQSLDKSQFNQILLGICEKTRLWVNVWDVLRGIDGYRAQT